ncbi:MAG: TIGR00282 family metallophosphoesterase [Syntrophomonas sp.]|nr:TIGR00282 family metallophosphoesterase [Syntrophomonas sp.]
MNILFIGDIVGRPGRSVIRKLLPQLQKQYDISFTIANAENAAGGRGLTKDVKDELLACGIDVLTMGNHVWDNKSIFSFIDDEPRLIRPANYPGDCPGQGYHIYKAGFNKKIAVINASGRIYLPPLDCPFKTVSDILEDLQDKTDYIIIDFHAEATSEKLAFGYYFDGKVSAIVGTHTHIQTADERIMPQGTAYITDLGMTGPVYSILGMEKEPIIQKFLNGRPARFEVATGSAQIQGVVLKFSENDKALAIDRFSYVLDEHN